MTTTTKTPMIQLLDRLWIDLANQPYADLRKGKTLRALHPEVGFVLAGPGVELADVIAEGREMQAGQDAPVVLVLVDEEDLGFIGGACGWGGTSPWTHQVPVRDLDMNGVGSIRLNTVGGTDSPNEHGYMARYATVARVLHKGDLFMVIDRNDDELLLVYRALADYDRRKNRVLFERTTPGVVSEGKQYMELAPNLLVYVARDGVEDARPFSEREARTVREEG